MTLATILTGRALPLAGSQTLSGIAKTVVDAPLWLGHQGLAGDEQADLRVHGGAEKAVHHYPQDHYATWQAELNLPPALGGFGENLSTLGLTEHTVAVGDIFRLGGAVLQVSQGRQPCWKLNLRFGVPDMARRVQGSGRTGWYYRVLTEGIVRSGDRLQRIHRVAPDWSLHRLWQAFYVDRMNLRELEAIAALEVLAEGWRNHAIRRLDTGRVEDWRARLDGVPHRGG